MRDSGSINKVILYGQVDEVNRPDRPGDGRCIWITLLTKETYGQAGRLIEHEEVHSVRLTDTDLQHDLEAGVWLYVEGKIKTTTFTDEQCIRRYKTEIMAHKIWPGTGP